MKCRLIWISFFAAFLIVNVSVYAYPAINNLSVQKEEIWLGETETIFLNCTDANSTISAVYADITTSTAIFPNNMFTLDSNGIYYLAISTAPTSNFFKTGIFNATVYCKNENHESNSSSLSFVVSNLSIEISSLTSTAYVGDIAEINTYLKKDGNPVTSNTYFTLTFDGQEMSLLSQPYYDFAKGWVLRFDTKGKSTGLHTISLVADYGGTSVSASDSMDIMNDVYFSVVSIDKKWVMANDDVNMVLEAKERGSTIELKKEHVSVQIDSTDISIDSLSPSNVLKFKAPSMPIGEHTLKVSFNYNGNSDSYSEDIFYVIPVSGSLSTGSDKTSEVQMRFTSANTDRTVKTDTSGAYSLILPSSEYSIKITDGVPTLEITGAKINNDFDDGIKYQALRSATVRGIQGAGIFFYAVAFDYTSTHIKVPYDQSRIFDESHIRTYACNNWNSGKKQCMSKWAEIDSKIDTVRKVATIDSADLNVAYIVGSPDSTGFEASTDKEVYYLNENIFITGISQDSEKNMVPNASITARIENTPIISSVQSNMQGIFSIEIPAPGIDGNYSIILDISKKPYTSSQNRLKIEVIKSTDLSILGPEAIRISTGESSESNFKIINTGQADLKNIAISLKGIPENYYQITPSDSIETLKSNSEKNILVRFNIPFDAAKSILGGSFEASADGFLRKHTFALTIIPAEGITETSSESSLVQPKIQVPENETSKDSADSFSFAVPTALITAGVAQKDMAYLTAFAVFSISIAFALRKRRLAKEYPAARQDKNSNKKMLFEIKNKIAESEKLRKKRLSKKRQKKGYATYAANW